MFFSYLAMFFFLSNRLSFCLAGTGIRVCLDQPEFVSKFNGYKKCLKPQIAWCSLSRLSTFVMLRGSVSVYMALISIACRVDDQ